MSSSYAASIETADRDQTGLQSRREHCSADPDLLATIGRALGHAVYRYGAALERGHRVDEHGSGRPGVVAQQRLPVIRSESGAFGRVAEVGEYPGEAIGVGVVR